jgi:hypothetical protein
MSSLYRAMTPYIDDVSMEKAHLRLNHYTPLKTPIRVESRESGTLRIRH